MTVAVTEYTDAGQMLADYAARRARLYGGVPAPVARSLVEPKAHCEPEPEPEPSEEKPWEPTRGRHNKPWHAREVKCLRDMAADGQTVTNIARHMKRSRDGVLRKARDLGIVIRLVGQMDEAAMAPRDIRNREKIKALVKIVADHYGCAVDDILGHSRVADIIQARHHAIWLCARDTKLTYPQIGRAFCRDHSTVIHAVSRIDAAKGENVRALRTLQNKGERL